MRYSCAGAWRGTLQQDVYTGTVTEQYTVQYPTVKCYNQWCNVVFPWFPVVVIFVLSDSERCSRSHFPLEPIRAQYTLSSDTKITPQQKLQLLADCLSCSDLQLNHQNVSLYSTSSCSSTSAVAGGNAQSISAFGISVRCAPQ